MARRRGRRKRSASPAGDAAPPPEPLTETQQRARRLRLDAARAERAQGGNLGPTDEQRQRHAYGPTKIKEPGAAAARIATRNLTGRAIDRYLARGILSPRQFEAADRYRDLHDRAGFERSIISRYDGGGGGSATSPNHAGTMPATLAQMDARERLREAKKKLPRTCATAFERMVCDEDEARIVGTAEGRGGQQAARVMLEWLRICCDVLADWWRLVE